MPNDFGFYGKGAEGYVHYMQAVDESNKGGGRKPPEPSGCLTQMIAIISIICAASLMLYCIL